MFSDSSSFSSDFASLFRIITFAVWKYFARIFLIVLPITVIQIVFIYFEQVGYEIRNWLGLKHLCILYMGTPWKTPRIFPASIDNAHIVLKFTNQGLIGIKEIHSF